MSDYTNPSFSGTRKDPKKSISTQVALVLMLTAVATGIGFIGYSFGLNVAEVRAETTRRRPERARPPVGHPMTELTKVKPSPMGEPVTEKPKVVAAMTSTPKMAGTYLQVAAVNPVGQKPLVDKLILRGYPVRLAQGGRRNTVRVLVGPVHSAEQLQTLAVRLVHDGYSSFRKEL